VNVAIYGERKREGGREEGWGVGGGVVFAGVVRDLEMLRAF